MATSAEVAALLERRWGLDGAQVTPLGGGMNSRTWTVRHAGRRYVLKHVDERDLPALAAGCEAAAVLAAAGLATGPAVPTPEGDLVAGATALLTHVPGVELTGGPEHDQRRMAELLARVHLAGGARPGPGTTGFLDDVAPNQVPSWLAGAARRVRAATGGADLTWSLLHTDPAPEAFRHDAATATTGLVDWTGARRGPVLYDVVSAVMYLGGPQRAAAFLDAYRALGPLGRVELDRLDDLRRFRWVVQGEYFAGRLTRDDRTGLADPDGNRRGLADARRGLADLGVA